MPVTYSTPKAISTPPSAKEVHCVGISMNLPRKGTQEITYSYEAVDADGNVVGTKTVTVSVAQVKAEKPAKFAAVYGPLREDAYERSPYPAGTVS